jgi:hypothetical protein
VPHHLTLCSSICIPVVVFQQSCFSIYVSACFTFVLQHLCSHLCCSICVCFQQSCFSNYVFSICDSAFVFQHLRFTFVLQHLCSHPTVVFHHLCSNSRVSASTFQHWCCSICVRINNLDHLRHSSVIAINDNLNHLC